MFKEKPTQFSHFSKTISKTSQSQLFLNFELLTLPLPFILWFITFVNPPIGFWPMLTLSTFLLFLVSLFRIRTIRFKPTFHGIIIGAFTGVLLFVFFYFGAQIANFIPGFKAQVSAVYAYRGNFPIPLIAVLLLFPIGSGEALYWQGFILRYLYNWFKPWKASVLMSFLYMLIHLPTFNPALLIVSLIVGLVWSYLFNKLGNNLFPVMLSHIIFDEFAFVLFRII